MKLSVEREFWKYDPPSTKSTPEVKSELLSPNDELLIFESFDDRLTKRLAATAVLSEYRASEYERQRAAGKHKRRHR